MYMFQTILEPRLAYSSICVEAKLEIEDSSGRLVEVCEANSRPENLETVFYYGKEYPTLPRHLFRPGFSDEEARQNGLESARENPIMLYWVDTLAPQYVVDNGGDILFTLKLYDDSPNQPNQQISRKFVFRQKLNLYQNNHEASQSNADVKFLEFHKIRKLERQLKELENSRMLDNNGRVPRAWHDKKQEIIGKSSGQFYS